MQITYNKHHTGCDDYFIRWAILSRKVGLGQTELVFVCDGGLLVRLCTQDYKSLCSAATI